jgi:hypothetical protein
MRLIDGSELTEAQKIEVLRAFVYRNTGTHCPIDMQKYAPQFRPIPEYKDDNAWLQAYAFYIRADGHLSKRHNHCETRTMADIIRKEAKERSARL